MREHIRIDRRRIGYLDSARRAAGSPAVDTRVLLLIHAFPVNADMRTDQVEAPPAGWRVIAPDLRGFGDSDADEPAALDDARPLPPSLDDYARDVLTLLDVLGIERVVLAGLSMGGYTAFAVLRRAAERVHGLVLANTKAEADGGEARAGRREMLALLGQAGVEAVVDRMLPRLLSRETRAQRGEVESRVRSIAVGNSADGVRGAILRMMNRPDSTPLLGRIACPTLVVASEEDEVTPLAGMRALQHRIAASDLAVLRGAGHLSNIEQPGEFAGAIQRFLAARFGG